MNCDIQHKIDQDLWKKIVKGFKLEPKTVVADFDAYDYFSTTIHEIDGLQRIFYRKK